MTTSSEIAESLARNREAEHGLGRSARAEELVELAASTGDRPLLLLALCDLIRAYSYSGQNDKMLVPFARLIRMWDERPEDFDGSATHSLYWYFKWVTGGMICHPDVPIATILRWLDDMEKRYRVAGYGMRAVYSEQYEVFYHIGDYEKTQQVFTRWLNEDRDIMSDCHACERSNQGEWFIHCGEDSRALALWQPVVDGAPSCSEEPHRILAKSLLPLVRLGRFSEARANHLRGYRMSRGNPSLRRHIGEHIEFAALTGNVARGVEILADHAGWLVPGEEDLLSRLAFLEAVAILLRELTAGGNGSMPVTTPGGATPQTPADDLRAQVEREISELTSLFDRRNGTTAVGERTRVRMSQRPIETPLVIGVKVDPLIASVPSLNQEAAAEGTHSEEELLAEAVDLAARHHPRASEAFERLATRGDRLSERASVLVAENRAVNMWDRDPETTALAFQRVAEDFAALGDRARALLNRARAILAASRVDIASAAGTEVSEVVDELARLRDQGGADEATLANARLLAAQLSLFRWWAAESGTEGETEAAAETQRRLEEVLDRANERGDDYHAARALLLRGQFALATGEVDLASELLRQSAERYVLADVPSASASPLALLAEIALAREDAGDAEACATLGLRRGADVRQDSIAGRLFYLLAEACWRQGGREGEVVDHALTAAQRLDADTPGIACRARALAAFAFHRSGHPAEAAAILDVALEDLASCVDEAELVRARRVYGLCLHELGEHRQAAQALLSAISVAEHWEEQTPHAALAHTVGGVLEAAGLFDEARKAFTQATRLWETVGDPSSQARATRALAWLAVRGEPDWPAGLRLLEVALDLLPEGADDSERWETLRQTAEYLARWGEQADRCVELADQAATGFFELGELGNAASATFTAAWVEKEILDRQAAATGRVRRLRELCEQAGENDLVQECDIVLAGPEEDETDSA